MKPSFSLILSHEGIRLFSRATGGWRLVGETDLDTPDLAETLAYLRDKATKLSGSGLSSKLILPSSQILFTSVTAPGPDDAVREKQIREALRDMTPYEPADLTFDWRETGDLVTVAAVANETLIEAEAFAVEHRFNPVSFAGDNAGTDFEGEPYFGTTEFSKIFLDSDNSVEIDTEDFVILDKKSKMQNKIFSGKLQESVLLTPAAESKVPPKEESLPTPKVETEPEVAPTSENEEAELSVEQHSSREPISSPSETVTSPESEVEDTSLVAETEVSDGSKEDRIASSKRRISIALGTETPSENATEHSTSEPAPETVEKIEQPPQDDSSQAPEPPEDESDAAVVQQPEGFFSSIHASKPFLNQIPSPLPDHLSKIRGTTSVPPSIAGARKNLKAKRGASSETSQFVHRPVMSAKLPEGIAARLKKNAAKPKDKPSGKSFSKTAKGITSSWRRKPSSGEEDSQQFASIRGSQDDPSEGARSEPSSEQAAPIHVAPSKSEPLPELAPVVPAPVVSESATSEPAPSFEERLEFANVTSSEMALPDSEHLSASLGREAQIARDNDFKPSTTVQPPLDVTVFGAKKKKTAARNKPHYLGLILLLLLLLVMGAAVLWSVVAAPQETSIIDQTPPEAIVEIKSITPAPDNEPLAIPTQTPQVIPAAILAYDVLQNVVPEIDLAIEPPVEQTVQAPVEQREPDRPSPLTASQALEAYEKSGIWQRSPEPKPAPNIENTDQLYVPSLDPAVDLSDAVALPLAAAVPNDAPISQQPSPAPAGSKFTLGDDGFVVPTRTGTLNPDGILVFSGPPPARAAPRPETSGIEQVTEATPAESEIIRPLPRPDNLAKLHEIARLGGRTREQLARIRPTARPVSAQIAAQTSPEGVALSTTATIYAVSKSVHPLTRPTDFAEIVKKALADPKNTKPEVAVATIAAKARVVTTGPKIPTRASVAAEATQKNMISLRKVSLIGVYGTPSKRSALVRMGNGKIVEVSVGDRVDGGKVAAIGADQVRYVKGGRNITLKMPPRS